MEFSLTGTEWNARGFAYSNPDRNVYLWSCAGGDSIPLTPESLRRCLRYCIIILNLFLKALRHGPPTPSAIRPYNGPRSIIGPSFLSTSHWNSNICERAHAGTRSLTVIEAC